jgi:aldose 1-epimerase
MSAAPARNLAEVAPRFRARPIDWNGIAAVELADSRGGASAVFARCGATLLDWSVRDRGETVALTDGYADAAEFATQNGVRNGVLAPFPNRIADGRYRFDGRDHDLLPGAPADARLIYHGFLRLIDLAVERTTDGDDEAGVLFAGTIGRDTFPGYPFALALEVQATLTERGIALVVTATNLGDTTAPYACGWHPYFRLGNAEFATLELSVPASRLIVTDDALMPLPGAAAFAPVESRPELDFRRARPLGAAVLDGCYADAAPDADGLIRSHLRDPATGRALTVWQQRGLIHVFTGDTVARNTRRAVAIEPVEAMTDAFNRDEFAAALRLAPGASHSFAFGAEFHAGSDAASASATRAFSTPFAAETA